MGHPDCPFCRSNDLLSVPIISTSSNAYLIPAATDNTSYLIIPNDHCEAVNELPDGWWHDVKSLLPDTLKLADYNISINIGAAAGQKIKHLHFWVIPRTAGLMSSNKGMAALIAEIDT